MKLAPRIFTHTTHPFFNQISQRMDKGDFAGKELLEIQNTNPTWFSRLEKDPFTTRYECVKIIEKSPTMFSSDKIK